MLGVVEVRRASSSKAVYEAHGDSMPSPLEGAMVSYDRLENDPFLLAQVLLESFFLRGLRLDVCELSLQELMMICL